MTTRNGWDDFADLIGRDGVVDNWEESFGKVDRRPLVEIESILEELEEQGDN